MPRGKKFTTGKVDETLEALNQVTPKQKTAINLKELIKRLKPKIKRLRSWGYEWHEIVVLLKQQGIEIAEDTLKQYLTTPRHKPEKSATKKSSPLDSDNSKKGKQVSKADNDLKQVETNKLTEDDEELKQVRADQLNQDDEELTTSTEPESELGSYQPIKLTMRK